MSASQDKWGVDRSDDDTWDIVSSVGYTALLVAGWRALHAAGDDPLVRDDYAKHFIAASADPFLNGALADPDQSEGAATFPRLYGVQTRFFDEFFASAAARGIRQAVIVAAGLDSRAYRLAWPTGTTVFEIDQPKVLEFKVRVLAEHAAEPAAQRRDVAADLREDWSIPLRGADFDTGTPTAWSVEGILPYLARRCPRHVVQPHHRTVGTGQPARNRRLGFVPRRGSARCAGRRQPGPQPVRRRKLLHLDLRRRDQNQTGAMARRPRLDG